MEIYLDLEKTLWNDQQALCPNSLKPLYDLAKEHTITILTTAPLAQALHGLRMFPIRIVSTLENEAFYLGEKQQDVLSKRILRELLQNFDKDIYTAYTITDDTTNIFHFQNRLKCFYPTKYLAVTEHFEQPVSMVFVALAKEGYDAFSTFLAERKMCIERMAEDRKRVLLKITNHPSTKESWLLKLKKSPAIGIGDSLQDYEFIKHCEIQVAMQNGTADLKQLCSFETPSDHQHNGAIQFLMHYLKHQTF